LTPGPHSHKMAQTDSAPRDRVNGPGGVADTGEWCQRGQDTKLAGVGGVSPVSQPKGSTMTMTKETAELEVSERPCPLWCTGCPPKVIHPDDPHFSWEVVVPMSFRAPQKMQDLGTGEETWEPVTARAYLEQGGRALAPYVRVDTGDDIEDQVLQLTLDEARDLAKGILELVDLVCSSVEQQEGEVAS
jgi:hypothetical protein